MSPERFPRLCRKKLTSIFYRNNNGGSSSASNSTTAISVTPCRICFILHLSGGEYSEADRRPHTAPKRFNARTVYRQGGEDYKRAKVAVRESSNWVLETPPDSGRQNQSPKTSSACPEWAILPFHAIFGLGSPDRVFGRSPPETSSTSVAYVISMIS